MKISFNKRGNRFGSWCGTKGAPSHSRRCVLNGLDNSFDIFSFSWLLSSRSKAESLCGTAHWDDVGVLNFQESGHNAPQARAIKDDEVSETVVVNTSYSGDFSGESIPAWL